MSSRAIAIPAGAVIGEPIPIPEGATIGDMPQFKAAPKMFTKDWFKEKFYTGADRGSNALPAVGGMAGGMIGAGSGLFTAGTTSVPGALSGAALGGSAGEASRQLFRRMMGWEAPQSSLEAAKDIGIEGGKQLLYEAGGQVLRVGGRIVSPKLAETAMSPGKRLLKSVPEDVNIGETVLTKTNGVRPKTITRQLENKIGEADAAYNDLTRGAKAKGITVSLDPSRNVVGAGVRDAMAKNSPNYIRDVEKLQSQLTHEFGEGGKPLMKTVSSPTKQGAGFTPVQVGNPTQQVPVELPELVDPMKARSLRQGIDLEVGSWNPESAANIDPLRQRVHGTLSQGIHDAVPGTAELDKEMSHLIPAKEAAWNVSYNPSITRNIFNRVARPTGALAGAGFGAYEGQKQGGTAGAVLGGIAGLTAPELVASPTGQMILARMFGSKWLPRLATNSVRFADAALQPTEEEKQRQKLKQRNPEDQ